MILTGCEQVKEISSYVEPCFVGTVSLSPEGVPTYNKGTEMGYRHMEKVEGMTRLTSHCLKCDSATSKAELKVCQGDEE